MKAFFLALTLINASPQDQDLMLADLYDADPRLAYEVLYVADELGADTDELAISVAIIADSNGGEEFAFFKLVATPVDDSTKNPDVSNWTYPVDDSTKEPVKYHKGF
ncbi:MAG: hypothetical protein ABGZ17_16675 [Planctomycetaceae bacterium]